MRDNDSAGCWQAVLGKSGKRFVPTDELRRDGRRRFPLGMGQAHTGSTHEGRRDRVAERSRRGAASFTLPIPIVPEQAQPRWKLSTVVAGSERLPYSHASGATSSRRSRRCWPTTYAQLRIRGQGDRSGEGVREYARKLVSSPGARDGLYWPSPLDVDESPLVVPLIAQQPPKGRVTGATHYNDSHPPGPLARRAAPTRLHHRRTHARGLALGGLAGALRRYGRHEPS
jgi:hypothetical protein